MDGRATLTILVSTSGVTASRGVASNARATGEAGIHQLLGYAVGDDTGEQGRDEEVLFGFDSDDRAAMEWGDVQCVWTLLKRKQLATRDWTKLRAVT